VLYGTTCCDPEIDFEPDHPPEALQDVVLVDDQKSVEYCPLTIELGEALKVRVGANISYGPFVIKAVLEGFKI